MAAARSAPGQRCPAGLPAQNTRTLVAAGHWHLQAAQEWLVLRNQLCDIWDFLSGWMTCCLGVPARSSTACPREPQSMVSSQAAQELCSGTAFDQAAQRPC